MRSQRLSRIREEVIKILKRLSKEVDGEVYLFGSYAEGKHTVDSDVDIIVVSSKFRDIEYLDRITYIRMKLPPKYGFDIIALTPEEFRKKLEKPFFKEISRAWIRVSYKEDDI
ncbi:nucleotidyltransferase domain-containing protein [Candidatus Geothermarchaeota archaeon]|nr:MAG: nucleotidyltransferase domain-containing protein [Candidatus Geothermarchaeota archaeon]